jgi:DNA-binding PadR family transcriptional regulator
MQLTSTSYVVLGLLSAIDGEATPYDLKQFMALSTANFWAIPHAQVYREAERLAKAGLLSERREETGRRRRFYALTDAGRQALHEWLEEAPVDPPELRDLGALKLFVGADPAKVAAAQLPMHEAKLAAYRELRRRLEEGGAPERLRLALEMGIHHERSMVAWWRRVLDEHAPEGSGAAASG